MKNIFIILLVLLASCSTTETREEITEYSERTVHVEFMAYDCDCNVWTEWDWMSLPQTFYRITKYGQTIYESPILQNLDFSEPNPFYLVGGEVTITWIDDDDGVDDVMDVFTIDVSTLTTDTTITGENGGSLILLINE